MLVVGGYCWCWLIVVVMFVVEMMDFFDVLIVNVVGFLFEKFFGLMLIGL